jgi:hypothetical protein
MLRFLLFWVKNRQRNSVNRVEKQFDSVAKIKALKDSESDPFLLAIKINFFVKIRQNRKKTFPSHKKMMVAQLFSENDWLLKIPRKKTLNKSKINRIIVHNFTIHVGTIHVWKNLGVFSL